MIPVEPKPEPAPKFDELVRAPGAAWLAASGLDLDQPAPTGTEFPPFWRKCLPELHASYDGVCAYLCIHFEGATGAGSTDHFVAKSKKARLAYEWSNYRLACLAMNSRKRAFDDVLDPFSMKSETFYLELVTGMIFPNPSLPEEEKDRARATIDRLRLDDGGCREMRARHFREYLEQQGEVAANFLRRRSPFVWYEARRQGLL